MDDTTFPKVNMAAVAAALGAMICLVFAPAKAIESARYALTLCAELIVPSLLPFFTASALLIRLQVPAMLGRMLAPLSEKLWGVSGIGASAFLAGICGGYPLGAQTVAEMAAEKQLTKEEAERLLAFCNNSGPAFLVGAVGAGIFGSPRLGLALYSIHALAAVGTGLLLRRRAPRPSSHKAKTPVSTASFSQLLPEAVQQTVSALLTVCGFVVCFTVFTGLLRANGILEPLVRLFPEGNREAVLAFLIGFWEIGGGIGALRGLPPTPLNLAIASAMVGWGGVSVQFQTLAVLADSNIKGALHRTGRLSSAVLSFCLSYLIFTLRS